MKVTVLQENLKAGLARVGRVISAKPQLPVLANVLLEAKQGKLFLTGTDLELGVRIEVGAKVEVEGKTTVPAKTFADFIASIPSGRVSLKLEEKKLKVLSGRYKASFQTIEASEFPQFPTLDNDLLTLKLEKEPLNKALQKVIYAAAKDSMRPILTGILFEVKGGKWRVVATDGFRLALFEGGVVGKSKKELEIVVPSRSVFELIRLGGDELKMIVLEKTNQVIFVGDDGTVVSQLLEGNYPNYRKIIPKESKIKILINRSDLVEGVNVAQVFARNNSNILKWSIEDSQLKIKSESPELGENEVSLDASVEGGKGEIAFNGKFLLDFLQNSEADEIQIELGDSLAPGSFREKGSEDFLYIVMPINL